MSIKDQQSNEIPQFNINHTFVYSMPPQETSTTASLPREVDADGCVKCTWCIAMALPCGIKLHERRCPHNPANSPATLYNDVAAREMHAGKNVKCSLHHVPN